MGTVLELSSPELSSPELSGPVLSSPTPGGRELRARRPGSTGTVAMRAEPARAIPETTWLTATIRPAGTFGRNDTGRLRALLDALSACASVVVLDLLVARLRSPGAGEVIEAAACEIEGRGGCLLCINADSESRACLSAAGDHAVLMDDTSLLTPTG